MTHDPVLIVTCIIRRTRQQEAANALGQPFSELDLAHLPAAMPIPPDLRSADKKSFARSLQPAAKDTAVLQYGFNGTGDARTGWEGLRQKLETAEFSRHVDAFAQAYPDDFWGYSLIYHATLDEGESLASLPSEALQPLFQAARQPHRAPVADALPIAQSEFDEGHLYLLAYDVASDGVGSKMGVVFASLSPAAQDAAMLKRHLYGTRATLLLPTIYLLKSYSVRRQYHHKYTSDKSALTAYKEYTKKMQDKIKPMFAEVENKQLTKLNDDQQALLMATEKFEDYRLTLSIQFENQTHWRNRLGSGDVGDFLCQEIRTCIHELDIHLNKAKRVMESVSKAIAMKQMAQNEAQANRERTIGLILGVLGIAFAVPQLVDPDAARMFIQLVSDACPPETECRLLELGMQCLITIVSSVAGFGGLWFISRRMLGRAS